MIARVAGLLVVVLAAAGCQSSKDALRVGAKSFAEQQILSEMLVALATSAGYETVQSVVECGDTYGCQRGLFEGRIDMMVEYSGTGLSYAGVRATEPGDALARVRALYEPLGIEWLGALGFDNGYRVLVLADRAVALGLESIADLAEVPGGIRVACPPSYLRRPLDSLGGLARRFGLRIEAPTMAIEDPTKRLTALLEGRVDVAIGYATDGALLGLDLVALEDSERFFPPYEAAIIVRERALQTRPGFAELLGKLEGRIDVATMQKLNYAVEVQGRDPGRVAREYLAGQQLI